MSEINIFKEIPECNFPINLKLIQKYQQLEPSIRAKYKDGTYYKGYFHGGSNSNIILITCKDEIFIRSKLQGYVVHCYHTYLLHPGMDRMEAVIFQHLHWTDIRNAVQK